jgi:release factor glutamine methyltransferase
VTSPTGDPVASQLRAAGCVWAEDEAAVLRASFGPEDLQAAVGRRAAGQPLEHVVGWVDFAGVRIGVRPPVFIPRPGVEPLVELAVAALRTRPGAVVVDVACGSGALALAVAAAAPDRTTVIGTDSDHDAVACARDNGLTAHRGHWLDALPQRRLGRVDVAVAHLPYVPTSALSEVPRDYRAAETHVALDGGADGLDPLRQVLSQLSRWLSPRGVLLTVTADRQASGVRAVLATAGRAGQACVSLAGRTFWRIS